MMNERAYSRNYEGTYTRNYYRNCGRSPMENRSGKRYGNCDGSRRREAEHLSFYQTYQIPLMILGSFLSGVLLVIGALA